MLSEGASSAVRVTPTSQGLNPNANVFQSKLPNTPATFSIVPFDDGLQSDPSAPVTPASEAGYQYINGDLDKLSLGQEGAMPSAPQSPDSTVDVPLLPDTDYTTVNGMQATLPVQVNPEAMAFQPEAAGLEQPSLAGAGLPEVPLEIVGLTMPELKAQLTLQLEYYFSRANLANDTYLVSQMDSDQYVPIWTVANFNAIRRLTKDLSLIVDVLRESRNVEVDEAGNYVRPNPELNILLVSIESPNVQVDEAGERVRPNHKRCTVILREIPQTTPVEEVKSIFKGGSCPSCVDCVFAHNNSWYATFENDEDAQKAYRYLREEVKTFQGKSILARIKAKPFAGSTYVCKNGYQPQAELTAYQQLQLQTQPQAQPQQQQHSPQQQPHSSHQQQPRYMAANYNAGGMPSLGYNGQAPLYGYAPFYPPSMLQAWTPQNQACFDIASVFSINGLSPQAAFKPSNGTGRTGYPGRPQHSKCHPRSHRLLSEGRHESRLHPSNHGHHHNHHHHHHHSLLLPMAAGVGGSYGGDPPTTVRGFGNRSASMDSLLAKWSTAEGMANHSSGSGFRLAASLNTALLTATATATSTTVTTTTTATSSVSAAYGSDRREDTTTQTLSSALLYRQMDDQSSLGGLPSRLRHRRTKKREDDSMSNEGRRNYQERSKSPSSTKEQKPLPKFDLEESSFPPLPGTVESSNGGCQYDTEEVFENRMADVVKGTAKASTRDSRTQASVPLPPISLPHAAAATSPSTKESSTLTNGDALTSVFTPPTSPSPPPSRNRVIKADKATKTDEFLTNGEDQGKNAAAVASSSELCTSTVASVSTSAAALPQATAAIRPSSSSCTKAPPATVSPPATMAAVVAASSAAPTTNGDITEGSTRSPSTTIAAVNTSAGTGSPLVAANKVAPTNSIPDSMPVRLSYAQMAQRAKDKVEKLAQEQKEKIETQERERRVKERELATVSTFNPNFNSNVNNKSVGGSQRSALPKDGRPSQRDSTMKGPRERQDRDKFERDRFRKFRAPQKENEFCGGEERWRERERETPPASPN